MSPNARGWGVRGGSTRGGSIALAAMFLSLSGLLRSEDPVEPTSALPPADSAIITEGSIAKNSKEEEFKLFESLQRDLTVIRTRTDLVSEFTDLSGSGWSEKLTLGSTLGLHLPGVGPEHEFGVRLQAPLVVEDPGPASVETGLGDVELKMGWAFIPDEENRLAVFTNFVFDPATDDILGDSRNDYSLGLAASHEVISNRFSVFVLAEYLDTITHENDVSSRNALELSFRPIVKIAGPLAFNVLLKDKWDFDADDHFALIEPGLSLLLLERHLGLSTSLEIPLDDESSNYVAKVGMVWFY